MNEIAQSYQGKPLVHAWPYCDINGLVVGYVGRYQEGQEKKDIVPFFKKNFDPQAGKL